MSKKIVLASCSGMNPRGEVSRAAVYDMAETDDNLEVCCIVATGGGKQKYIDLASENPIIAVNGCKQDCTTTLFREKNISVDKVLNVRKLLEDNGMEAQCTVRMNENDEKCVEFIKKEIQKAKEELL